MAQPRVALQLYTVRTETAANYVGTLRAVAKVGYKAVELAGYGGLSAVALKAVLDELGLTVAGAHIGLARLETALDEELAFNAAIGNTNIVCPMLPAERRTDEASWQRAAALFAGIGQRCRAQGARLSYHNHAFEFEAVGSRTGMEILLDETDAADLAWEPDVYWVKVGGQEPAQWLRRYAGRTPLVHLKDMTAGPEPTFAEVGEGIIDFKPILAETAGADWYVVEQDRCARPALESIALSLGHLNRWGYQ